jgi:hypothetical protein
MFVLDRPNWAGGNYETKNYYKAFAQRIDHRTKAETFSALRGPDANHTDTDIVKYATTSVLRKFAFPKTFSDRRGVVGDRLAVAEDDSSDKAIRRSGDSISPVAGVHFVSHICKAFKALDMVWSEENVTKGQ